MQRYFVKDDQIQEDQVTIKAEDAHHIMNVMRMKEGDKIEVCDESNHAYVCQIEANQNLQVIAKLIQPIEESTELPIRVTIAQGLPKGDKFELIVQKATELGVTAVLPFASERSIVKWDQGQKVQKKLERLRKIAKEAAEQSHRASLPTIEEPVNLKGLISLKEAYTHKLVAFEESAKRGERHGFANLLDTIKPGESLLVVIGPEGGLSSNEVNELTQNGFSCAGLGPRILRTETASLYVLAALSYHFELAMR
ncbi:16S rRNA (uracil(1498)-N(3))-methyltransferase [Pullulanibacillus sp. KACC 23026]|uniref:16S rRNA (uracil(1498)-N(3))-methyltransferase n=1 Tax=Pullulanibacillus sp. KACC 23026 TaxID=3028315 RepID=UPI0023AEED2F|nr:16S rRNA (uracil(1498)-N(3))-methyltransferase [Pullulanibacillus sp. KACC 23026]WEG14224.1 16S rRNA (uracil(1498)-N(3))-methyltransferase [Pullulanibacillus sp. KACC 23026]